MPERSSARSDKAKAVWLVAEIRRQVKADMSAGVTDIRKGLVELARGISDVRLAVEDARREAATDLSHGLAKLTDRIEAVAAAPGSASVARTPSVPAEAGHVDGGHAKDTEG
ncbi:MAG: hypothetical protein AVDCRST_MAG76-735 [uncultured Acidimicrobiales bacterium]|uniref:Uncharacterized protein n=1 Tax=uncultured Acidimicrobiales bacterium TaxID=310071 RepID=A0A6J4HFG3_9ACTN|nr:MAG: hypothetical protein AVDCRST_MAG76-735 [uncultured Acidimicrobiales bacterium]